MKGAFAALLLGWVMCMGVGAIPCSKEVVYKVVTDCEWTSETYPTDYPTFSLHSATCKMHLSCQNLSGWHAGVGRCTIASTVFGQLVGRRLRV